MVNRNGQCVMRRTTLEKLFRKKFNQKKWQAKLLRKLLKKAYLEIRSDFDKQLQSHTGPSRKAEKNSN